mgnify:CR=1 FL=1|tara:strand:+ start:2134 stop:2412 length:279 start_codon:yes stop_codon:yes gene_type:complete
MVAIVDNKGTITTRDEDAKTLSDIQATKQWYIDNAYALARTKGSGTGDYYKAVVEQLDMLYKDIDSGKLGDDAKTGSWYLHIKAVKDSNPKS